MDVNRFFIAVIGAFIATHILIVGINPRVLTDPPTRDNAMEIVDRRASESIAIFSIVVAVLAITAVGREGTPLSNASLSLSASFLIFGFFLREIANLTILFYEMQDAAIRFGAVLLFLSMYYYTEEQATDTVLPGVLLIGVFVSIFYLIIVTMVYLATQKKEWDEISNTSRRRWIRRIF